MPDRNVCNLSSLYCHSSFVRGTPCISIFGTCGPIISAHLYCAPPVWEEQIEPRFAANRPENWCLSVPQKAEDSISWLQLVRSHICQIPFALSSRVTLDCKERFFLGKNARFVNDCSEHSHPAIVVLLVQSQLSAFEIFKKCLFQNYRRLSHHFFDK